MDLVVEYGTTGKRWLKDGGRGATHVSVEEVSASDLLARREIPTRHLITGQRRMPGIASRQHVECRGCPSCDLVVWPGVWCVEGAFAALVRLRNLACVGPTAYAPCPSADHIQHP